MVRSRLHRDWLCGFISASLCAAIAATAAPSVSRAQGTKVAPVVQASHPYVVLVSFDAFRHDYFERYRPEALTEIAERGVRASAMIPSFPSKTFPNHYTLATGLYPGHHGIVGNTFYDPSRDQWYHNNDSATVGDGTWYGGEPIWVTAERNGVKAGTFYWTGSEAEIKGMRPSYWVLYDKKVPNATRVDSAVSWLRKPPSLRPHLVCIYFSTVDDTTHKFGPDAPQTAVAVSAVDRALRRLLDSIAVLPFHDSVNVVVVSDHGMATAPASQVIPVGNLLLSGGVDTTGILMSDNGPTMSLWFRGDSSRQARAYATLSATVKHAQVYRRSETPSRWHMRDNIRAGDLMLVADEGFTLQHAIGNKPPERGQHGYDPELPDMHAIFFAAGPNIRKLGTIAPFENVNVYPFVAALLRLQSVPAVDGTRGVLEKVLK